jgi:hypothetical protein
VAADRFVKVGIGWPKFQQRRCIKFVGLFVYNACVRTSCGRWSCTAFHNDRWCSPLLGLRRGACVDVTTAAGSNPCDAVQGKLQPEKGNLLGKQRGSAKLIEVKAFLRMRLLEIVFFVLVIAETAGCEYFRPDPPPLTDHPPQSHIRFVPWGGSTTVK